MLNRDSHKPPPPCGWLVNDKPCKRGSSCGDDHDPYRIKHHKQKMQMSPRPCWKGEMCEFLTSGCCIYYHPPSHVQRDLLYNKRSGRRENLIRQNLKFLGVVNVRDMGLGEDVPVRIQDVHAISSFNKIANNQIAVPGVPPRLHPLTQQLDLELDYHNKSLGRNYPSFTHHFEPLVRSIEATDPDYDLRQTDIVTNASNLRKMFMILLNQQSEYERYDLTWRNNILFLSKWTSDPSLNSSLGHGSGFEQATCIYDDLEDELLKSSASHHRVIQYRFGGLQLVVQSEVDAYHCDCHCPGNFDLALPETLSALTVDEVAQHRRRSSAVSAASSGASSNNLSVLSSDLSVTSLDCHCDSTRETTPASPPPSPCRSISMNDPETPFSGVLSASGNLIYSNSSPNLRVLRLGREIPARCLVEVKTHKVRNKPLFNAEAQLYFSQLSKLYIAKNDNGSFLPTVPSVSEDNKSNNPVEEKTEDIRLWVEAEQNQKTLQKVVALLKRLKDLAKQFEKEKGIRTITLLMRNDGMGEERGVNMKLYERTEECGVGGCLPEDYLDAAGWPGGKEEMGDEGLEDEAAKEEALKDEDLKDGGLQDN